MIVDDLIRELQTYPPDWEIMLQIREHEALAQSVDMESGGTGIWVMISDKHEEKSNVRRVR